MRSSDAYILQRVYEEGCYLRHPELSSLRLFQKFAFVYGQSISHPSLRQAVLLYCRPFWWATFDEVIEQRHRALHALRMRINDPDSVDEGDLFASYLIAMHFLRMQEQHEGRKHVDGFFSILRHLVATAEGAVGKYPLQLFWSLAKEELTGIFMKGEAFFSGVHPDDERILEFRNAEQIRDYNRALDLYDGGKDKLSWTRLPGRFFLYLKNRYSSNAVKCGGEITELANSSLAEIQASLDLLDERWIFEWLSYDNLCKVLWTWGFSENPQPLFAMLFCYHLSYLLLSVLLEPSMRGTNAHSKAMAGIRLFESFRQIDDIVDQFAILPRTEEAVSEHVTQVDTEPTVGFSVEGKFRCISKRLIPSSRNSTPTGSYCVHQRTDMVAILACLSE